MSNLTTVQIKAFVPSKDFELAKRFYSDLGFTVLWSDLEVACLQQGTTAFLLQNYYVKEFADNLMMHMLVEDLDAWWRLVSDQRLVAKYSGTAFRPMSPPVSAKESEASKQSAWSVLDFVFIDPTGVLWRIGQASV